MSETFTDFDINDYDGDGDLDILASSAQFFVGGFDKLFINNLGAYQKQTISNTGNHIISEDLNNDGLLDIIGNSICLNTGTSFVKILQSPETIINLLDLDNDNEKELIIKNNQGNIKWLKFNDSIYTNGFE